MGMECMEIRPHHLLDIISSFGAGSEFKPAVAYGHAVHTCAEIVLGDLDTPLEFVAAADFICAPCIHLVDGVCDDTVGVHDPPVMKQDYNDALDRRLLAYFGLAERDQMTFGEYLRVIADNFEGLAEMCSHPNEEVSVRDANLRAGLDKLGVTT